jgi:glycosyltransferase involved in cell wall biosynthesis
VNGGVSLPISAVIPAFNAERFILGALASIAQQTRPPAEVIVVDDGSTDRTGEVAASAGARVVRQNNAGAGAARTAGARAARFPWIAYLDADDRWLPEKLELQWAAHLQRPDVRIVATDYQPIVDGRALKPVLQRHRAYRLARRANGFASSVKSGAGTGAVFIARQRAARALPSGYFLFPSSLLVERALVTSDAPFRGVAELPSAAGATIAEDAEWAFRALCFSDVLVVERPLVAYNVRAGSHSAGAGRMRYGDVILGDWIRSHPAGYAPGAAAAARHVRRRKRHEAALAFMREREPANAQSVLRESAVDGLRIDDLALLWLARFLDASLGRAFFDTARRSWKRGRSAWRAVRLRSRS